jgi:hypothetical protein
LLNACAEYEMKTWLTSGHRVRRCGRLAADTKQEIARNFSIVTTTRYLRFGFGTREKQGLQTFADLCSKHGVLQKRAGEFEPRVRSCTAIERLILRTMSETNASRRLNRGRDREAASLRL